MTLLGCKPAGRHTEQHDVFFGIGKELKDLVPDFQAFWPEAADKLHLDGFREVNFVGQYQIRIVEKSDTPKSGPQLFFLNLGGYKPNEMEEFHYKILSVNNDIGEAIRDAKQTTFFKHTTFGEATSHVDDKYGVDVDDIYVVNDILPLHLKGKYQIEIEPVSDPGTDELHLGYFQLHML
ncbi:DUF1543 domain-containing protein [Chitinophaga silvatica]|uniref:DUF1543 domain-containing protein n=2 Tax=Chitinophaga silvatica TaxID=2282649 RepID=A0A3E1Y596_9BACT|nr:DUF1543 domain-containing protein [Chitinophaga silvatica]